MPAPSKRWPVSAAARAGLQPAPPVHRRPSWSRSADRLVSSSSIRHPTACGSRTITPSASFVMSRFANPQAAGTQAWLRDIGAPFDLAWKSAMLSQQAADQLEDPRTHALGTFDTAHGLLAAGAFDLARAQLEPALSAASTATVEDMQLTGILAFTSPTPRAPHTRSRTYRRVGCRKTLDGPPQRGPCSHGLGRTASPTHTPATSDYGSRSVALWPC